MVRIVEAFKGAGSTKFVVVCSPGAKPAVESAIQIVGDVSYSIVTQDRPTGMSDALLLAQSSVPRGAASVIVTAADALFPPSRIASLVASHAESGAEATLSVVRSDDAEMARGHGNFKLEGDRVLDVVEKPTKDQILGPHYSPPVYVFSQGFFALLAGVPVSPRGERELQDAIKLAIDRGWDVRGVPLLDEDVTAATFGKHHLTTPRDLWLANVARASEASKPQLDAYPTIIEPVHVAGNCIVDESCLVGPNAVLENANVGPYCEVSNSVLLSGATLGENCKVDRSIVAQDCEVPARTRLFEELAYTDESGQFVRSKLE